LGVPSLREVPIFHRQASVSQRYLFLRGYVPSGGTSHSDSTVSARSVSHPRRLASVERFAGEYANDVGAFVFSCCLASSFRALPSFARFFTLPFPFARLLAFLPFARLFTPLSLVYLPTLSSLSLDPLISNHVTEKQVIYYGTVHLILEATRVIGLQKVVFSTIFNDAPARSGCLDAQGQRAWLV